MTDMVVMSARQALPAAVEYPRAYPHTLRTCHYNGITAAERVCEQNGGTDQEPTRFTVLGSQFSVRVQFEVPVRTPNCPPLREALRRGLAKPKAKPETRTENRELGTETARGPFQKLIRAVTSCLAALVIVDTDRSSSRA